MTTQSTGLNEKFPFRGSITEGNDFYMVAVLKEGNIGPMKTANNPEFDLLGTEADKYFFLCHNQYTRNEDHLNRLYWSSDPDDFQKNTYPGYRNEGVARLNFVQKGANTAIRYRSSLPGDGSAVNATRYNFLGYDMENLTSITDALPLVLNTIDKGSSNYALDNSSFYYSVPYKIDSAVTVYSTTDTTQFNSIPWNFRRFAADTEVPTGGGVSGVTVPKPTDGSISTASNGFNFVYLANLDGLPGTNNSNFNYGSVKYYRANVTMAQDYAPTDMGFSIHGNAMVSEPNYFPGSDGIVKLANGAVDFTDSTVLRYHEKQLIGETDSGFSFQFNLSSTGTTKGMTGYNTVTFSKDAGLSMYFNERNHPQCFVKINEKTTFSDWFDIYFLPVEENAYFPGGVHINDIVSFPSSCSKHPDGKNAITPLTNNTATGDGLNFFSSDSTAPYSALGGDIATGIAAYRNEPNLYYLCNTIYIYDYNLEKENKYRKIYNLVMFDLTGSLNTNFWTLTGQTAHNNIANYTTPLTFYAWSTYAEARAAFMFDYCTNNERCGYCYGKNTKGEEICFADSLTRRYALGTNKGSVNLPLTGHERATGTHSRPGKHLQTYVIVIICVLVVLLFVVVGSLMYVRRKRWREGAV